MIKERKMPRLICLPVLFLLISFIDVPAQKIDSLHIFASMTGEKSGDYFYVVKGVGDINGDGYDDVVVGAPGEGYSKIGGNYAKLYYGGAVFDTVADVVFRMPKDGRNDSNFGNAIVSGDFNSDGYKDIAIGAPYDRDFRMGRVFIYFGGASSIDTTADKVLTINDGFYYYFGKTLASGDVNGDGIDDLIVGAPFDDISARGRIFFYFGGKNFGETIGGGFVGENGSRFGYSVAIAGDVNKDGCMDIIVGAASLTGPNKPLGKAYLIYGNKDNRMDSIVTFLSDSNNPSEYFGSAVSGLGDVDGDGYNDFGVASNYYLKIYSGKTLEVIKRINITPGWNQFTSLTGGFDLNGDHFSDIIVGVENREFQYAGASIVFLGGKEIDTIPAWINNGRSKFQYFGRSIDYAGDVNGDGFKDLIVGASGVQLYSDEGHAYLLSMNSKIDDVEKGKPAELKDYKLYQNYPNPFNPTTTIAYYLPVSGHVTLKLYNILGSEVATLLDKDQAKGSYTINFDASHYSLSSGIYILKLSAEDNLRSYNHTIKLSLIK